MRVDALKNLNILRSLMTPRCRGLYSVLWQLKKGIVTKKNQAEGNVVMQCEVRWGSERQKWWTSTKIQSLSTLNNKQMQHEIRLCEQGASLSQLHHEFPEKRKLVQIVWNSRQNRNSQKLENHHLFDQTELTVRWSVMFFLLTSSHKEIHFTVTSSHLRGRKYLVITNK